METSLHQHAGSTERDSLIDLRADFFHRSDVSVRRPWPAIERTESAHDVADVRVVDIAIDDVRDNVVRMTAAPNLVRRRADAGYVVRFKQCRTIIATEAATAQPFVQDTLNLGVGHRL